MVMAMDMATAKGAKNQEIDGGWPDNESSAPLSIRRHDSPI